MTNTTAVPAETTGSSHTFVMADTESSARRGLRGMSEASRWVIAGIILVIAVGTQLMVGLLNSSTGSVSDFAGNHWLQLVIVASGFALVIGGIVKNHRH